MRELSPIHTVNAIPNRSNTVVSGDDIIYMPPAGAPLGSFTYDPNEPYSPFIPLLLGNGVPFGSCVSAGGNRLLDTRPNSNDVESTDSLGHPVINSGADGRCDTRANNTNTPAPEPISAVALENFINNSIWGKQANYYVNINTTVRNAKINFDFNRDGFLDDPNAHGQAEYDAIRLSGNSSGRVPGSPVDMYFIGMPYKPVHDPVSNTDVASLAITERGGFASIFGNEARALTTTTGAHELGHAMGDNHRFDRLYPDEFLGWMMYSYDQPGTTPCRTGKPDWVNITFIESAP